MFDRKKMGTSESRWRDDARFADADRLKLAGFTHLVVVAAHPDDESLGAGGLIARSAATGLRIDIVVATDGEKSHPGSSVLGVTELARVRRSELRESVAAVAPHATIVFLGLPDAGLRAHGDSVATTIRDLTLGRHTLVVAPWSSDGHGDHEAAGLAAQQAVWGTGAELLEYPIWLWHWAGPHDDRVPWASFVLLDLSDEERKAKADAIQAHETQHTALSDRPEDQPVLEPAFLEHFSRGFEAFVRPTASATTLRRAESAPAVADSLRRGFFDRFYSGVDDPWGFETRWYEKRKRAITLASLPRERFAAGLEVGCSVGVLTEQLADRCDSLLAVDIADRPLDVARRRLEGRDSVSFDRLELPREWPSGTFDLIVVSEVGYYWGVADRDLALARIEESLAADGVLLLCHWRHAVPAYPETGDAVHHAFAESSTLVRLARHEEEDFLLDVLARPGARSVAGETGLL